MNKKPTLKNKKYFNSLMHYLYLMYELEIFGLDCIDDSELKSELALTILSNHHRMMGERLKKNLNLPDDIGDFK